jgi:hypothetical protein
MAVLLTQDNSIRGISKSCYHSGRAKEFLLFGGAEIPALRQICR